MEISEQRPDGMQETEFFYCAWQQDGRVSPYRITGVAKAASADEAAREAAEELAGQLGLTNATIQVRVARFSELAYYAFTTETTLSEVEGG